MTQIRMSRACRKAVHTSLAVAAAAVGTAMGAVAPLAAQGWHYPEFQVPRIVPREFSGLIAGGSSDYGTSFVGQWREPLGTATQVSFEAGLASPSGIGTVFTAGAGLGLPVLQSTAQTPIDVMLTGGAYFTHIGGSNGASGGSGLRVPVGAVVGHRIPLTGTSVAITPYVHPRASIDFCLSNCGTQGTHVPFNFDIGGDVEITSTLSLRAALTFGSVTDGPSDTGFGVALAYRPAALGGGHR